MDKSRFFIDENLPAPVARSLQDIFPSAKFVASHQLDELEGTKDVPLLRKLGEEGFSVFVTQDLKQMRLPDERHALRESGIH